MPMTLLYCEVNFMDIEEQNNYFYISLIYLFNLSRLAICSFSLMPTLSLSLSLSHTHTHTLGLMQYLTSYVLSWLTDFTSPLFFFA